MICIEVEHGAQALDRLRPLAIPQIHARLREQLIGITFERRGRGTRRALRWLDLDLFVFAELELVLAEVLARRRAQAETVTKGSSSRSSSSSICGSATSETSTASRDRAPTSSTGSRCHQLAAALSSSPRSR